MHKGLATSHIRPLISNQLNIRMRDLLNKPREARLILLNKERLTVGILSHKEVVQLCQKNPTV